MKDFIIKIHQTTRDFTILLNIGELEKAHGENFEALIV